ncbi:hypothetical protein [Corynebacterium sphenisci]|uniref:hypothetical protein n=1 Tax=Corynebacterium sphenisci TaxID=191493 RepID=UPI0026DEDFEF|nr:hypothetical protein [Corynebacterium sphenisci]MDO5730322.1 hypothetical protein [Corynebacterium sphenisci]
MYAALWRALPGPTWVKALEALALLAAVLWLLFTIVFPAVAAHLPWMDVAV